MNDCIVFNPNCRNYETFKRFCSKFINFFFDKSNVSCTLKVVSIKWNNSDVVSWVVNNELFLVYWLMNVCVMCNWCSVQSDHSIYPYHRILPLFVYMRSIGCCGNSEIYWFKLFVRETSQFIVISFVPK